MANKLLSVGVAVIFVGLLVALSDPFMLWMPQQAQMVALLVAALLACIWTAFVMYEKAQDEREVLHKMYAGRVAYLCGMAVLTLALLLQGVAHAIDPFVSWALGAMVVSKLVARLYFQHYR